MSHPYPQHIKDAITEAVYHRSMNEGVTVHDIADIALQALWDASRVDTVEQLEALPDNAIVHDGYFSYEKDVYAWRGGGVPYYITHDEMDLPMTIIYWGDTDEQATNY